MISEKCRLYGDLFYYYTAYDTDITDNASFGAAAAEYIGEKIGGSGEVVLVTLFGSAAQEQRELGFIDYLAENYPDVKVDVMKLVIQRLQNQTALRLFRQIRMSRQFSQQVELDPQRRQHLLEQLAKMTLLLLDLTLVQLLLNAWRKVKSAQLS